MCAHYDSLACILVPWRPCLLGARDMRSVVWRFGVVGGGGGASFDTSRDCFQFDTHLYGSMAILRPAAKFEFTQHRRR